MIGTLKLLTPRNIYKYKRYYDQQEDGFSLVEIIVVLVMVGILGVIAIPSWFSFVNQQRINKANDLVLEGIQEAQQKAKREKRSYSFSFKVESNIPKFVIHPDFEKASDIKDTPNNRRWNPLGEDLGIKAEQVILLTNLTDKNTVDPTNSAVKTSTTYLSNPQTITFDYMGTLPNADFGKVPTGSTEPPGLKIVVAGSVPGNPTSTSGIKRCVIIQTLLGSMVTGKGDEDCK